MSVTLKITLGTVNYTNFLHVTVSKVSSPTTTAWETWIAVPVTNYNFVIPNLDPENYYVRYYDATTNSSLGTLVAELIVNALSGDTIMERRFYTCGGLGAADPVDGATLITDTYLIGKNVAGVFKEGFRYLKETDEYSFTSASGVINILNGTSFATNEKFIAEIKYTVGNTTSIAIAGLYAGTLNVPEDTKTLTSADKDKRIRLVGTSVTQVITLPALSTLSVENGFYFDNSCGGTAIQVKLLIPGTDRIRFNGFYPGPTLFSEFWVSRGEHILIRKFDANNWELLTDYKGVEVGSRQAAGYLNMPGYHAEDGALSDGDEYGRVWFWINIFLPPTHVITDDTCINVGYTPPINKTGQFVKHSTLKKFRWPNTQGLSEKGLANFNTYGTDTANRLIDYPGGYQAEMVGPHIHPVKTKSALALQSGTTTYCWAGEVDGATGSNSGTQTRVSNIGVIYCRKI